MVRRVVLPVVLVILFLFSSISMNSHGGSILYEMGFTEGVHENTTVKNGLRLEFGDRSGEWTLAGSSPQARTSSAMAYSPTDDLAILFGGRDDYGKLLRDTWQLMDGRWIPLDPEQTPSARSGHSLTYIDSTDEILLFGGRDESGNLSDLRRFNLTTGDWEMVYTKGLPGARAHHQLVYDPENDVAVLLGGFVKTNKRVWAYHPMERRWEAIEPKDGADAPHMSVRLSAAYIGDGRILMYGGYPSDNWETNTCWIYQYSTNTWDKVTTNIFPNAYGMPTVYIPERNEVFFYGHYTSKNETHTWLLNLTTMQWSSPRLDYEPRALGYYAISYLQSQREVVMMGGGLPWYYGYGGYPPPDSPTTWLLDIDTLAWSKLRPTALTTVVHIPDSNGIIVNPYEVWHRGIGDEWTAINLSIEYGLRGAAAVYMEHAEEVLYFGGIWSLPSMGQNGPYNFTNRLDLGSMVWDRNRTGAPPTGRMGHTLVYDPTTRNVVMFGGNGYYVRPDSLLGDSWSFDPDTGTWTEITAPSSPTPRTEHIMIPIPGTGESMLFGGILGNGTDDLAVTHETWMYNATKNEWRNITGDTYPTARHGAAAAYCPSLDGVLLFGGNAASNGTFNGLADTWLFYPGNETWIKLSLSGPTPRYDAQMVYDSSTGSILLLGGRDASVYGWIYDMWTLHEPVFLSNGTYTSQVFDLGGDAYFGDIVIQQNPGLRPPSDTSGSPDQGVTVRLRTGDTRVEMAREDFRGNYTESTWIDPIHNSSRFIQFMVELGTRDSRGSPRLDHLEIRYNLMHSIICDMEEGETWTGFQNITWKGWDLDGDQLSYDVYIDNGTGWTVVSSEIQDTWYQFNTSTVENGGYLIKIVARDDNVSIPLVNETTLGPFQIVNRRDRPPTAWMLTPLDGATISTSNVTLSWDGQDPDGDPILFYLYVFFPVDDGEIPVLVKNTTTRGFTLELPHGKYSWKVVPKGGTCLSSEWSFNVTKVQPPPPQPNRPPECILVSPANGAEIQEATALLVWDAMDPDGDDLTFTIHVMHYPLDGDGPIIDDHRGTSSQILIEISPGWTSWWVTASDGDMNVDTRQWTIFRPDDKQPPNDPPRIQLIGPNDGERTREGTLTFEWSSSDEEGDSLVFHLYISHERSDVESLLMQGPTTTEHSITLSLQEGRYYWTVVVDDGGSWTVARIRSVDVIPDLDVTIFEPIEGAIVSGVFDVNGQVANVIDRVVVMVRVDGGSWQVAYGDRRWSITLDSSALGAGPHEIEVHAVEGDDEDVAKVNIRVESKVQEIDETFPWALLIVLLAVVGVVLVIRERVMKGST
jgi:hypothetical protein